MELDPWGGDTSRSWQQHQQPQRYTTYHRDGNESDEAMFRRYNRWWSRFDQPDPFDGSYDLTDPQSLNRYSYTQNDPVNFTDPTGLDPDLGSLYALTGSRAADLPGFGTNWGSFGGLAEIMYEKRCRDDRALEIAHQIFTSIKFKDNR